MPKEKKTPTTCTLGIHPGDRNGKCPDPSACAHCGWHPEEHGQGLGDPGHWPGDRPGRPPAAGTPQEVSDSGCAGADGDQAGKRQGTRSAPAAAGTVT